MLVIVPIGLTDQWVGAIRSFLRAGVVLPHNQQRIELVDISASAGNENAALRNFIYGNRRHEGLGSICVTSNTVLSAACVELDRHARGVRGARALRQQPCMIVCDEAHNITSSRTLLPRLVSHLVLHSPNPVHVLAISGSPCGINGTVPDFAVIESISQGASLDTWYQNLAQYTQQLTAVKRPLTDRATEISRSIPISNLQRQLAITEDDRNEALDIVRRYDQAGRRYAAVLPLLQRRALDDYLGFPIPRVAPRSRGDRLVLSEMVMGADQRAVAKKFLDWLETLVPRRVRAWGRISNDEPTKAATEPTLASDLFTLESEAEINAYRGAYNGTRVDMSLVAFAPGLAPEVLDATNRGRQAADLTTFRVPGVNAIFRGVLPDEQRQAVNDSAFGGHEAFAAFGWDQGLGRSDTSPKINAICTTIDQMLLDRELHVGRDPALGPLTKKAIICVPYPWHAYILIAFLFHKYPNRNFTYIGAAFGKRERADLLEPFRRQTITDDPKERDPNDPIALIGTYNMIAEGLDLTRCNYVICTSPLGSDTFQLQLSSRVFRRGQHCQTHTSILVDHGDPSDVVLYHRMLGRTPDTVPEEDIGRGLRYLLDQETDADVSHLPDDEDDG